MGAAHLTPVDSQAELELAVQPQNRLQKGLTLPDGPLSLGIENLCGLVLPHEETSDMRHKATTLLQIAGTVAVVLFAVDAAVAENRVARPGRTNPNSVVLKSGGADCGSATPAPGPWPFVDTDTTCGKPSLVSDYNNVGTGGPCNTYPYPGPELIYTFSVGAGNDVMIQLAPTNPADMGVFIVSDCANTLSCVGFADAVGGGAVSVVDFMMDGLTPGSYWVYVDSFYAAGAASCGNYTLTIDGIIPVELMEFSVE